MTSAGVVPTPAVAYLDANRIGYDAGVVISASHNPFEDNGIKVFSGRGEKFTERVEREVEAIVADQSWQARSGEAVPLPTASLVAPYLDHLRAVIDRPDTAAGHPAGDRLRATAPPRPSRRTCSDRLGFDTIVIGDHPDGRNINLRERIHASRAAGAGRRREAAVRWASPSMATATGRFSSTGQDRSSTAMPCCSCAPVNCSARDG